MATAPTPIPAGPAVPNSALPEPTFDAQYEAFNQWERDELAPKANALAQNVYENASEVVSNAASAASSASIATAQADAAMGYRNSAQASANTATSKAAEADASAIAASKLNLGDKATPPTTDNQGDPLRAGATYYDTTLRKWRVWTGSDWDDGLSAVAGVSSLNGEAGALVKTTLAGYGITDAVKKFVWLASGTDLNNVVESGFYRLTTAHINWPSAVVENGQMIVSRGGETLLQILTGWNSGRMWFRQAVGIGATPSWGSWRRLAEHSETPIDASGGVMDCLTGNYFTAMISANTTLSFANIPAGAYSCVLEVHHTAGTMTFPSDTVWSGAAPTLSPGRHLFFFQRAQIGTAGWYASALPGYSA